jgi:hypothetical protein
VDQSIQWLIRDAEAVRGDRLFITFDHDMHIAPAKAEAINTTMSSQPLLQTAPGKSTMLSPLSAPNS